MTEQILFSQEYRLTSGGASIHFRAEKNALTITEISNSDNKNILSDETACPLPSQIEINGEKLDIAWTFTGSETTPKENCTEAVFRFEAPEHNLEYMLFCRAWDTPGPFLFEGTVINTASEAIRIIPGNIAAVELDCSDVKAEVWKFSKESGWAEGIRRSDGGEEFKGAGITVTPLAENTDVIAWVNTEQNFNASGSIPLLYVSKGDSGFMMALEWSSGRVSCESSDGKTAVLTATLDGAGPRETVFSTKIAPQGKLDIPPVYVLPYLGDVDNGSNILKSWFFRNRAPKNLPQNTAEPLTQMDMQIGLDADKINVDAVKWDYGWWSDQVFITWRSLEGSWQLRNSAYIGVLNGYGVETLPELAKLAHDRNVSWTVYLLLHDPL
ncbi:MAG: hypothetical protein IKZ19_07560, partial [Clostridia bacterium]|nr:hypothetical protein [Clostridia bacterium]